MNDKYEEWLIQKVNMLKEDIDNYNKFSLGKGIPLYSLMYRYDTYKECLEKYKEEKGE